MTYASRRGLQVVTACQRGFADCSKRATSVEEVVLVWRGRFVGNFCAFLSILLLFNSLHFLKKDAFLNHFPVTPCVLRPHLKLPQLR